MPVMLVTFATFQSRGWLKLETSCPVWRGGGEECSGARAEPVGCGQGGRLVCGGTMGQRPGRTQNMYPMFVTRATSQSRGWLKLLAPCQVWRGGGEECLGVRGCRGSGLQARREARVR